MPTLDPFDARSYTEPLPSLPPMRRLPHEPFAYLIEAERRRMAVQITGADGAGIEDSTVLNHRRELMVGAR